MDALSIIAKLTLDSSGYDRGLADSANKANGMGSTLNKAFGIGAAAVAAATTAVAGFAASSVKVSSSFDSAMSQVAATMGYTVDELNTAGSEAANTFNTLSTFAQKMGSETAFSASQAADALNYMALAGYDAETSMEMLPNVLNLAAAGGIELASASDMVTDAQSALGLSLEETSELVDKMAKASSKSNTSVAQLGDAILTIGGTAKSLAGGTTELSAALGILADNGIKGAEGGTALRNVLLGIQGDKFEETFGDLGVKAYDAQGNLRELSDILSDMSGVMDGMTDQQKTDLINKTFNRQDLKTVNALLATTTDRWDELSDAIDNSTGAARAMADVQLDNLEGDVTLFKSALEGAKIAIGQGLSPELRKFVQFGSKSISTLTAAFNEGGLSGAMSALGDILSEGITMIMEELPAFVDAGMELLSALGQGLIDNLPILIDAAVQIAMQLGMGLIENLPKIVEAAIQIIMALGQALVENAPVIFPMITQVILAIVDMMTNPQMIVQMIDLAFQLMTAIAKGLIQAIPQLIAKIPEIIAALITGFKTYFMDFLQMIPEILYAIGEAFAPVVENIKQVFADAWQAVKDVFAKVGEWFGEKFEAAKEAAQEAWSNIKEKMSERWEQVKDAFSETKQWFSDTFAAAKEKAHAAWEGVKQNFTDRWNEIKDAFSAIGDWFSEKFSEAKENALGAWNNVKERFSEIWENIKSAFDIGNVRNWGRDMIDNFIGGIKEKWDDLKSTLSEAAGMVKDFLGFSEPDKGPLSNFHTYAPDMMKLFAEGIADNEHLVTDQIAKSFDFGEATMKSAYGATGAASASSIPQQVVIGFDPDMEGFASYLHPYIKYEDARIGPAMAT